METIKISDADTRHLELMAGLGAIERALLLINDTLRLQKVETGPENTQTEQEKIASMERVRKAKRQDFAKTLNQFGMNDSVLQVLKQEEEGGKFKVGTKVLHLDKGEIGVVTGQPSEFHGLVPVKWDGHSHSTYENPERLEVIQQVLQVGQRVSSKSDVRGGLGTITRFSVDGKRVGVDFDHGPELWIEACDLELIGGAA